MKNLVLIILVLISISCSRVSKTDDALERNSVSSLNFDWLSGTWVRSNDEEGYRTYEHWIKSSSNEYTGFGYTLQDGDTIFKENLRLLKTDENWNLEVSGVNENPTLFLLINHTEHSFTAENMLNEFPKIIEYSWQNDMLLAKISGGDTEISFSFERMQQ